MSNSTYSFIMEQVFFQNIQYVRFDGERICAIIFELIYKQLCHLIRFVHNRFDPVIGGIGNSARITSIAYVDCCIAIVKLFDVIFDCLNEFQHIIFAACKTAIRNDFHFMHELEENRYRARYYVTKKTRKLRLPDRK